MSQPYAKIGPSASWRFRPLSIHDNTLKATVVLGLNTLGGIFAHIYQGAIDYSASGVTTAEKIAMTSTITRHSRTSVLKARYVQPSQMYLKFADGAEWTWTFDALQLNMSGMKVTSIKASISGAFVEVTSKWGDEVKLDSSALRVLTDPEYAAELKEKLDTIARQTGI